MMHEARSAGQRPEPLPPRPALPRARNTRTIDKKPITPTLRGAIDDGPLGMMLSTPSPLGPSEPAEALPSLFGGIPGGLNGVTKQPLAIKGLVPFPTHG